jgi:hypothetical protein
MGPCRGIKEIRLQAAGGPTVVMDDKWPAGGAGFKIGESSVADSEASLAWQLHFLYGDDPI